MIPELDSAEEAGRLLGHLPVLWAAATLDERHDLVTGMLDVVYFDLSETKTVLAIKPKPPFAPVFGTAAARAGSGVELLPKACPEAAEGRNPRRVRVVGLGRGLAQICVSGGDSRESNYTANTNADHVKVISLSA